MTDAYIVQMPNGTTIEPVYSDNPFIHVYIAPIVFQLLVLMHNSIRLITRITRRI